MKKVIAAVLLAVMVSGCTSHTEFGECIGAFDEGKPGLKYKASAWNIAIGLIFAPTIFAPVYVIVDQTLCPVGKK